MLFRSVEPCLRNSVSYSTCSRLLSAVRLEHGCCLHLKRKYFFSPCSMRVAELQSKFRLSCLTKTCRHLLQSRAAIFASLSHSGPGTRPVIWPLEAKQGIGAEETLYSSELNYSTIQNTSLRPSRLDDWRWQRRRARRVCASIGRRFY